jgi:hypothetical protein
MSGLAGPAHPPDKERKPDLQESAAVGPLRKVTVRLQQTESCRRRRY